MTILEVVLGAVALFGVLLGAKLLSKPKVSNSTKIEHEAKVARDKAVDKAVKANAEEVAKVRAEEQEARSRPVSDVLVDLIRSGEVVR